MPWIRAWAGPVEWRNSCWIYELTERKCENARQQRSSPSHELFWKRRFTVLKSQSSFFRSSLHCKAFYPPCLLTELIGWCFQVLYEKHNYTFCRCDQWITFFHQEKKNPEDLWSSFHQHLPFSFPVGVNTRGCFYSSNHNGGVSGAGRFHHLKNKKLLKFWE